MCVPAADSSRQSLSLSRQPPLPSCHFQPALLPKHDQTSRTKDTLLSQLIASDCLLCFFLGCKIFFLFFSTVCIMKWGCRKCCTQLLSVTLYIYLRHICLSLTKEFCTGLKPRPEPGPYPPGPAKFETQDPWLYFCYFFFKDKVLCLLWRGFPTYTK